MMEFVFGMVECFLDAFVVQNEKAKPRTRKIVILTVCALLLALCAWMTWSAWADQESLWMRIICVIIDVVVLTVGVLEIYHEHKNGWKYKA